MSDLKMTRLCAEAMEYTRLSDHFGGLPMFANEVGVYDPLHDDAQAMALVKRCNLHIDRMRLRQRGWIVSGQHDILSLRTECTDENLNRAIVGCVAKMQASKP